MKAPTSSSPTRTKEYNAGNQRERMEFVRSHRTAIFGYKGRRDGPSMSVVYYVMDGDDILVSTMAERGKARAIRRDPKISLRVLDEKWPPTYLQVYCNATIETDIEAATDPGSEHPPAPASTLATSKGRCTMPARLPRIAAALCGILGAIMLVVSFRIHPAGPEATAD